MSDFDVRKAIRSFLAALLLVPAISAAQVGEPTGQIIEYHFDSGNRENRSAASDVVVDYVIAASPETSWLRILFAEATLGPGSRIRLTSLLDGEVQVLDAKELRKWRQASAFFNGSEVRIELIAGPRTTRNVVRIEKLLVSKPPSATEPRRTICDTDDERVLSSNPAVARLLDAAGAACTGFIVDCPDDGNDKCHLTAGHCFSQTTVVIAEFEVPASTANCGIQHPPVAKQFPIDPDSVVSAYTPSAPAGNDWAVFRCETNSAGKTSFEEQGAALELADNVPTSGTVRITGYGSDSNGSAAGGGNAACAACGASTVTGQRYAIQQTDTGPLVAGDAGVIDERVDTCGGNSGSPIIFENTGRVIGIHTNGGCDAGGMNQGTEITLATLQDALTKCDPHTLVLLDRTGSMLAARPSTGNTRCHDALALAKADVASFFAHNSQNPGASVAVWTFADSGPTNLTGGFGNQAAALAALNSLDPEGCGGLTPLADALCASSDSLVTSFPTAGKPGRVLTVSSDGGENNSTGLCSGPGSNSGPPYDPGSWQQKTTDHLADQGVVLSRFWGSVVNIASLDSETGRTVVRAVADEDFFRHLSERTGGDFQAAGDNDPLPPPFFPGQGSVSEIPTLEGWLLLLLSVFLGLAGWLHLRRKVISQVN